MSGITCRILEHGAAAAYSGGVADLYRAAKWIGPADDISFLKPMLENTFCVCMAFDGERPIGLMRALSDGVSDAYLLDMIVLEEYRHRGIATLILNRLIENLKEYGIDWIVCISVPEVEKLYLQSGELMEGHTPVRFC